MATARMPFSAINTNACCSQSPALSVDRSFFFFVD
jgi:hypothetical protein